MWDLAVPQRRLRRGKVEASLTQKAILLAERVQNDRLRQIIKELQRHRFGRRAETLPEDQMLLGLEDVEQAVADRAAETTGSSPEDRQARAHKRRINRGALPGDLPRIEIAVVRRLAGAEKLYVDLFRRRRPWLHAPVRRAWRALRRNR
jgi:Transposase C of IS166 homeodomain